uniref:Uncharacterized protein n=1 Tax=Leersia perrieri TaxID=77586 RepID=A0A0D9X108_9ORYZ
MLRTSTRHQAKLPHTTETEMAQDSVVGSATGFSLMERELQAATDKVSATSMDGLTQVLCVILAVELIDISALGMDGGMEEGCCKIDETREMKMCGD